MTAARRGRARLGAFPGLVLSAWAVAILIVGAFLMAGHLVSLPAPAAASKTLAATLVGARHGSGDGRWSAVHVLYEGCGCSSRVLSHLIERGARPDLDETVVYARGATTDSSQAGTRSAVEVSIRGAGFHFEAVTPAELEARYQVESAPLLLVVDARGAVRYAGGYTDRSGAKQISDTAIIDGLRNGGPVRTLPVFGCAVSHRLQQAIDPLALKYRPEGKP